MVPQVVVLAAGLGSRLGRPHPKTLTPLSDGRTILGQQVENVRTVLGDTARVMVVVGFKCDMVMESHPDLLYAYNERFDTTNTSKSLLRALRLTQPGGVLWMNGDVVFSPDLLSRVVPLMKADDASFACVTRHSVGDEEVSYTLDDVGAIGALRKGLADGLGEAIGINYVAAADKNILVDALERCGDMDYFERGMEIAIAGGALVVRPVDVGDLDAVEVDFPEDLRRANAALARRQPEA